MSGGNDERDQRAKGLANEILPDPSQAEDDLAAGGPRGRTVEHLKRILAAAGAAVTLQGAVAVVVAAEGCTPSGGAAEKKASDAGSKDGGQPAPPPTRPPEPPGYGVVDPIPEPYDETRAERRRKHKKKADGDKHKKKGDDEKKGK